MQNQPQQSALGLDANVAALIGYPIGLVALISVFIEKDNKFVRFHAFQSLFLGLSIFAATIVLSIVIGVLTLIAGVISPYAGLVVSVISLLVWLVIAAALLGVWVLCLVKAYGGGIYKLPLVGNYAEKMANK